MYRGYILNIDTQLPSLMQKLGHNEEFSQLNEGRWARPQNLISEKQQSYAKVFYSIFERSKQSDRGILIKEATIKNFSENSLTDIFPQIDVHVFLSHSHRDKNHVLKVAEWLKSNFDLDSFIDSEVWQHLNNLAKSPLELQILEECLKTSLRSMIRNTECFLFLSSPNSIQEYQGNHFTPSKWILDEIEATRVSRKSKNEHRAMTKMSNLSLLCEDAKLVLHPVNLMPFCELAESYLDDWIWAFINHENSGIFNTEKAYRALDDLYSLTSS